MLGGTRKLRLIMRGIRRQPRKKFKPTFGIKNNYASLHIEFIRFEFSFSDPTRVSAVDLNVPNDSSEKVLSQIIIVSISAVKLIAVENEKLTKQFMDENRFCLFELIAWMTDSKATLL